MMSLIELKETKKRLEEQLMMLDHALSSDEYAKPFSFSVSNPLKSKDFKNQSIQLILDYCESRSIGFDPNLTLQHIEHEVLDQFNEIVKREIKGKSIEHLMGMRHELELFMLTDRKKQHEHNLKNVEADLNKLTGKLDEALNEEELKEETTQAEADATTTANADVETKSTDEKIVPITSVASKKKKG